MFSKNLKHLCVNLNTNILDKSISEVDEINGNENLDKSHPPR